MARFMVGQEVVHNGDVQTVESITEAVKDDDKMTLTAVLHFAGGGWGYTSDCRPVEVPIMAGDRVRWQGKSHTVSYARSVDGPGGSFTYLCLDDDHNTLVSTATVERLPSKAERVEQVRAAYAAEKAAYEQMDWSKREKCPCCHQDMPASTVPGYDQWRDLGRKAEELGAWIVADGLATVEEVIALGASENTIGMLRKSAEYAAKHGKRPEGI